MSSKNAAVRLNKLLAHMGYGSRRDIARLVELGAITLNGIDVTQADGKVEPGDELQAGLEIDGEPLDPLPGMVVMLHKPVGVTCSHKEAGPLVFSLLPERWRRRDPALSSVGRLDKDTSGLLLLTDDGALLHRMISPRAGLGKTYHVTLARPLEGREAAIFAAGTLMLDSETTPLKPAHFVAESAQSGRLTLYEGRYHQARRMFAALGNHVTGLHRLSMGGLELPASLPAGAWQLLDSAGVARVFAKA
ncbi:MAG: rRNA pseudouridine synthase [Hyphomicrobiales bacterium]|nr:rRNA pseudouridine synthase [Hyphomicrobiales bacterium]